MQTSSAPGAASVAGVLQAEYGLQHVRIVSAPRADRDSTLFRVEDACGRDWIARLAPRERDLMFIGAGVAGHWRDAQEAIWFYEGYGPQQPDAQAMAYYRCERRVERTWWTTGAGVAGHWRDAQEAIWFYDSAQGRPAVAWQEPATVSFAADRRPVGALARTADRPQHSCRAAFSLKPSLARERWP